jgi:hypothetical protein
MSTIPAEEGGLWILGQPGLYSETLSKIKSQGLEESIVQW